MDYEDKNVPQAIKDVNVSELISEWNTCRDNREKYTEDFPSLDNLVDGVPVNHQKNAPYVGELLSLVLRVRFLVIQSNSYRCFQLCLMAQKTVFVLI